MMCQRIGRSPIGIIGFGTRVGCLAHAEAQPSAEEHDFHGRAACGFTTSTKISGRGIGTINCAPQARTYESCTAISLDRFHGKTRM